MNIATAYGIVNLQNARIKTLDGKRFIHKGFEYEIRYEGGFACFVGYTGEKSGNATSSTSKELVAMTVWERLRLSRK